jgi:MarR family transcriptional regulator, organic hydroperoxide resistance regulator
MILNIAQQEGRMAEKNLSNLRFNGSIWCNLDIALRNVDQIFRRSIRSLGITVIEWYILRALYEQDGQHASELARAVGRAATSFTPNLDKLQKKDYIERRSDPGDRRAVRIFLTDNGKANRDKVLKMADDVDAQIASAFSGSDFQTFLETLSSLQSMLPE